MTITPTGAEAGTDTEPTEDFDLDSALAAAWEGSNEEEGDEDSLADETADEDTEDDAEDADDEEVEGDDEVDEESEDDTDDIEAPDTHTVKVDGEEIEVTVEEALAGYMRQADYTKKTQSLSSEKEKYAAFDALSEALRDNPQDALTKLARLYGVDLAQSQDNHIEDPLDDLEPALAAEIREMRSFTSEFRADQERRAAAERSAAIDAEIEAVRVKFSDTDLDEVELLEFAVNNGVQNLEAAYKALAFEKANAPKAKSTKKVVEQKRKAPPVEGGRNRSKGVVKGVDPLEMSVDQAFEMALSEHGKK